MAEGDTAGSRGQHTRGKALLNSSHGLGIHGLEDADVDAGRNDGDRLDQPLRDRPKARNPGEDSVLDCCRKRVPACREDFGDEEGIAARVAVELGGVEVVWRCEIRDRGCRQRAEGEARDRRAGRDVADEHPQRVGTVQLVVPVGTDRQYRRRFHLAGEQPDDVQGGVVSPVEILQNHDARRACPQLVEERRSDLMGPATPGDHRLEVSGRGVGDVKQRAEWVRRGEGVACSREDSHGLIGAEASHQRRLADAGLTADENEASGRGLRDRGEVLLERSERFRPLEQIPQSCNGLRRLQSITSREVGQL